jgi:hypothetical protein
MKEKCNFVCVTTMLNSSARQTMTNRNCASAVTSKRAADDFYVLSGQSPRIRLKSRRQKNRPQAGGQYRGRLRIKTVAANGKRTGASHGDFAS